MDPKLGQAHLSLQGVASIWGILVNYGHKDNIFCEETNRVSATRILINFFFISVTYSLNNYFPYKAF